MNRYVAVIDLGKTNSKVALVDTMQCAEVQVLKQPAVVIYDEQYPHHDHKAIEVFLIDALQSLVSIYPIDALTVTTHGATAALVSQSGELALPVLDYEFTGIDEIRDEYETLRPSFVETGSPSLPGGLNMGAQLFWQQKKYPKSFTQISSILTWPQYWIYRFTGERYNDVTSLGCHTDLYAPRQRQYSKLVHEQHWHTLMPPTKQSGQLIGTTTPNITKRAGLSSAVAVYTGIHDSNASLVSHLMTQTVPFSVVSTGTWFISMAIGGLNTHLDEKRDSLINVNAYGDSVPSARFMGGRERELLNITESATEQGILELLNMEDTPTMLMPSVVADTGPYPDINQNWLGLTRDESSSLKACAVTLYLALMTHECMLLIGANGPTYIEGPLAKDHHFAQMLSAVSEREVMLSDSDTGTSVGAAMLVNPSAKLPAYTLVTLNAAKREKLELYAKRWKQALSIHLRSAYSR